MNNQTANSVAKLEAFQVRFEGFEALPAVKGRGSVFSPEFKCFGHQWKVQVYPAGAASSNDGRVSVFLSNLSSGSIEVQAIFVVKQNETSAAAGYADMGAEKYQALGSDGYSSWGRPNFARRSALIGALRDGALVIEVRMKEMGPSTLSSPFLPTNPCYKNLLKKFRDEESADVVFEVRKEQSTGGRKKRTKGEATIFHAHRLVLPENGALAEACESSSDLTPIPITGVDPSIFRHLLVYLYGGQIDDEVLKENAKDIIDGADRFGVVGLKLEAEASLVKETAFTMDNALDNLLYADAKNCALLKESVVDFMVENADESIKRLTFDNVPGSLLKDFMTAMARGKKDSTAPADAASDLSTARVDTLRKMLNEKGLDVDGSREAMIARLEEHSSERQSNDL